MSQIQLDEQSSHRKPLGILIGALGLFLVGALVLLLGPIRSQAMELRSERAQLLRELGNRPSSRALLTHLREVELRQQAMVLAKGQWKDWVNTLGIKPSKFAGDSEEDLRIDYKVSLFNSRLRLIRQADEQGVQLPDELGMPETIDEDDVAVVRLWQLEAIEKLLMECIRLKLPSIESVNTLPTLSRNTNGSSSYPHHEFPVRIEATAYPQQITDLLKALQQKGQFFALRRFSVERKLIDPQDLDRLHIQIVAGAKLFQPLNLPTQDLSDDLSEQPEGMETFDILDL